VRRRRGGGETLHYSWLNTGLAASIDDGAGGRSVYGYDASGNRTSEHTTRNSAVVQNATAGYDAMGRMRWWEEAGNATSPAARIDYAYDANGNVRSSIERYKVLDANGNAAPGVPKDHWNLFDSMNRLVVDKGQLVNGAIVRGSTGALIEYDAAGQRKAVTRRSALSEQIWERHDGWGGYTYYRERDENIGGTWQQIDWGYSGDRRETFAYNADGTLDHVHAAQSTLDFEDGATVGELTVGGLGGGALASDHSYDLLGRFKQQVDHKNDAAVYDRSVEYNGKSQVVSETTVSARRWETWKSHATHQFGEGAGYALGAVTQTATNDYKIVNGAEQWQFGTTTTNSYGWHDGAVVSKQTFAKTGQATHETDYRYDGFGQLYRADIRDGRPRSVTFTNDMSGQVLRRDEADGLAGGDPHEVWYRFGGRQLGFTGNNGTLDTDYAASIDNRVKTQGTGAFRFGESQADAHADFSQSLEQINSYGAGGGAGSYTARAGETLASIAAQLWGDASLWYKLAEANGLSGASGLSDGQTLTIPAGVIKNTHNAGTFKPYDPLEALGDTSPTSPAIPKPPRRGNKCGMFGAVLLVVVAVAVTIATSGAFLTATGAVQGGLSAGISATLGIGGATGAAAGVSSGALIAAGAVGGAVGSAASQGLGVLTGLQDKFSWKGVAMAGITAGLTQGCGRRRADNCGGGGAG